MNGYPTNILNGGSIVSSTNPLPVAFSSNVTINLPGNISLNTGSNFIGYVGINQPVQNATGSNFIGYVGINQPVQNATGSNFIGYVGVSQPVQNATGSNFIGYVGINQPVQNATGSNFIGYVGVVSTSSNPVTVAISTSVNVAPYSTAGDAFGRLRTSQCYTLGDYKHLYAIDPLFVNSSNGGSITFNINKACATLATDTNSSSYAIHQTRAYHNYQPGKSHFIMSSINFYGSQSNVVKRTGYFDDSNGIYVELDGNNILSFNIRNSAVGSITHNRVAQSNWNVDRLDGTGPSGYRLDMTKTQLFFSDFQWLGVGRVRCGFSLGGGMITAHEYYHANNLPSVYIAYPSLPIRCEIRNTGPVSSPGGTMDQICSTVISEGGYVETGLDFSYITSSGRSVGGGAVLPVLSISLKNTHKGAPNRMIVKLISTSVLTDTKTIIYEIRILPSVNNVVGGSWVNVDTDSGVQYNVGATSIANLGTAIGNGLVPAAQTGSSSINITSGVSQLTGSVARQNFIAQNFDSTDSQVYVIYVRNTDPTNATNVYAGMQWREVY